MSEYYKKYVYPFAANLISDYIFANGYNRGFDISWFPNEEISKFAGILLAEIPEDHFETVWNEDIHNYLIAALRTSDRQDKAIYAQKVIENVIEFYRDKIENILENIYITESSEFYESRGIKFKIDDQTGEGEWQ